MVQLTNSPREATVLKVEARKSFAMGLWVRDSNSAAVDLTDTTISFVAAKVSLAGVVTELFTELADLADAGKGYARFNIQASDLDLAVSTYSFTITLLTAGYSVVLLKGDLEIQPNVEFDSVGDTYLAGNPTQTLIVALQEQHVVHVDLTTLLPPDVVHMPPGGATGMVLTKASDANYDLLWTLTGDGSDAAVASYISNIASLSRMLLDGLYAGKVATAADIAALEADVATLDGLVATLNSQYPPTWASLTGVPATFLPLYVPIATKTGTDLPSTYPTGYSYMTISSTAGWPVLLATIVTTRYGTNRTTQTVTEKTTGAQYVRSETDGNAWGVFTKLTTATELAIEQARITVQESASSYEGTVAADWTYGKPNVTLLGGQFYSGTVSAFLPARDVDIQPGSSVILERSVGGLWTIVAVRNTGPQFLKQISFAFSGTWRNYDSIPGDPIFAASLSNVTVLPGSGRHGPASFTKSSSGWVLVSGLAYNASATGGNSVIGILPVGFRPSVRHRFQSLGRVGGIEVRTNGEIVAIAATGVGATLSLNNVRFNISATVSNITGYANSWVDYGDPLYGVAGQGVDSLGWGFVQGLVKNGSAVNNTVIATSPTAGAMAPGSAFIRHQSTASVLTEAGAIYISDPGIQYNTASGGNTGVALSGAIWDPLALAVPWVAAPYLNSWASFSVASYSAASYYLRADGLVAIRGFISTGTIGLAAFVLPEGYRPKHRMVFETLTSNNVLGRLDIYPDGQVVPLSGSSTWFSIEGILFPADH